MKLMTVCAALAAGVALAAEKPAEEGLIWSDVPTKQWTDAYPIGNGVMGAMVFGNAPETRLQFNRTGLWTHAPRCNDIDDGTRFLDGMRQKIFAGDRNGAIGLGYCFAGGKWGQAMYQPCGDLYVKFDLPPGVTTNLVRRLSIREGYAGSSFAAADGTVYDQRSFAPYYAEDLVIHTVTASKPGALACAVRLTTPHTNSTCVATGDTLGFDGHVRYVQKLTNAVHFAARAKLIPTGAKAKLEIRDDVAYVTGADALEIRLTAATNRKSWKELAGDPAAMCDAQLAKYAAKSAKTLFNDFHTRHFIHRFGYQSHLTLPGDPALAKLPTAERLKRQRETHDGAFAALVYAFGKYLLYSCSRQDGESANLQGMWNDQLDPPWGSKYTCNINIQMNYWPAEPTGLAECHWALFRTLKDLMESGRHTAQAYYGCRGWVLHHNYDGWMTTAPTDGPAFGLWPMGGAWFALHLWEHYLYHPDEKGFLANDAWPVMSEAARFFTDFLIRHPKTGKYVTCPSMSPEHGGLDAGPAMDMQIVRALYRAVLEAAAILGKDKDADISHDALVRTVRAQYPELQQDAVGKWGQLQEWIEDRDDPKDQHRHFSHLWAVYPGDEINWTTPKLYEAAKVSLVARGDEATGWSMGWKINCWARFKDGDHAMKIMDNLFKPTAGGSGGLYDNLFDAHPPFQIDGNFGATAGIVEMLVQSHVRDEKGRHVIELLPALPTVWKTKGSFEHVHTRGGFEISFAWEDGKIVKLEVESKSGVEAVLKFNGRTVELPAKKGKIEMAAATLSFGVVAEDAVPAEKAEVVRTAVFMGWPDIPKLLKLSGKANPKVLVFETAKKDDPKAVAQYLGQVTNLTTRAEAVILCPPKPYVAREINEIARGMREKILSADVIYFDGGQTEILRERLMFFQLEDAIRVAYRRGTVIGGYSAGAILISHAGVTDFPGRHSFLEGLGLVPAYFVPHYQGKPWQEFDQLLAEQPKDPSLPKAGYACMDGVSVIWRNEVPELEIACDRVKGYSFHLQDDGTWKKVEHLWKKK